MANKEGRPEPRPVRETSGLAIAAFVLSLVWLFGLGSFLAIVLSWLARRSIRRSGGLRGGEGLAVAGLVLGIVGLLGGVLVAVLAGATKEAVKELTPKTVRVAVGRPVVLGESSADPTGIVRITVYGIEHPAVPQSPEAYEPEVGHDFAVADIEVCAGEGGSQHGLAVWSFALVFPNGQTAPPTIGIRTPDLVGLRALGSGQCARGYLTFEIAKGTTPSAIRYSAPLRAYEWEL